MRTTFTSLAFASESASRLAALLPALSLDQARSWTAQVYGYRNWHQLAFEVENAPEPGGPVLTPDLKYALDVYYAGKSSYEDMQRHEMQIQKLDELLGWSRRAAEHLYVVWEPRKCGAVNGKRLANVGTGTPAYQLMQRNIFVAGSKREPLSGSDVGYVYLGFPGTAKQLRSAAAAFLASPPVQLPIAERLALAADLTGAPQTIPRIRPVGGSNTFAQVLPMTFVACRDIDGPEIIGVASVTFALIASCDGTHLVKITLERVVALADDVLVLTFADAMAVAVWEAVTRYLWTTVGNPDNQALVRVEYRADVPAEQVCANEMLKLIVSCCACSEVDGSSAESGIKFELSPQAN